MNHQTFDPRSGSLIERALFNHRCVVLLLCALVTALLGWQAGKLQLNASFDKTIPSQHPYIVNFLQHQNDLTGLGNAVRIAVESPSGSIYDAKYLDSYGFGFRIAFSREATFRVEWGYGDEGTNFTLAFGNSF